MKKFNTFKIFIFLLIFCGFSNSLSAQLSAGDIAFVGWNTDSPDGFSFVALVDIPPSEVINFSENGWNRTLLAGAGDWYGNAESHFAWTAPLGGLSAGSIVSFVETAPNAIAVTGGGAIGSILTNDNVTAANFNLSAGDNVFAYQGTIGSSTPAFIAGLYGDDNYAHGVDCDDLVTGWFVNTNHIDCASIFAVPTTSVSTTNLPPALTNAVNAVHLFPAPQGEQDNAKYNGPFTGTAAVLLAAINDQSNWIKDNSTNQDIDPPDYNGGLGFSVTPAAPLCLVITPPVGTTIYWMGCTDSAWGTATNWSTGAVPTINDIVYIPANTANDLIITQDVVCSKFTQGLAAKVTIDFNNGGKLNVKFD